MTTASNSSVSSVIERTHTALIANPGVTVDDLATIMGEKPKAIKGMLTKLEKDAKARREEAKPDHWVWYAAEPKTDEPKTDEPKTDEPAVDFNLNGSEWVPTNLHSSATKSLDTKTGKWFDGKKTHTIAGWWIAKIENGVPVAWLDLYIPNKPEKMKLVSKLRWTWKTESTGLKNIEIVRAALPGVSLVQTNHMGEVIKVYSC